tara:strand:- start:279 stop:485 length:207 start_codon:yes stop_codon:yes gene_type:complete
MGLILISKILWILLYLSILNIGKEVGVFLWNIFGKEEPTPLEMNSRNILLLGLSTSYVLLSIFNGIQL